ncbi:MAG: hypothetical protein ACMXYM_00925 [Candidatus Woesearchaeota archaeon]
MGVLGVADSDPSKKLEADIEFIKTRLDLIARQMASGALGTVPNLDGKLRSIYEAVSKMSGPAEPPVHADIRPSVNYLSRTIQQSHADIAKRFETLEARIAAQNERIEQQNQTIHQLKDAVKDLLGHLRNG